MPRIDLPPYQRRVTEDTTVDAIQEHLQDMDERVGQGPFLIPGYAVASLPDATLWGSVSSSDPFTALIFIYDETGGATLAFSDGTNWRRVQDRAIVS